MAGTGTGAFSECVPLAVTGKAMALVAISPMPKDIRDRTRLNHQDVTGLSFVKDPGVYYFRRHYRAGLRSHIMEVLRPADLRQEREGIWIKGVKWFPKAKPIKMLRIFRTRFKGIHEAREELKRVKTIEHYLAPEHLARSEEFLADHGAQTPSDFLLCGLQEYVEGEILDPWSPMEPEQLMGLLRRMEPEAAPESRDKMERWALKVRARTARFVERLKKLIYQVRHLPDLAGVGNLILTPSGNIKLVDINNISKLSFGPDIQLDDQGYPVADKSIEALAQLEEKLLGKEIDRTEQIYGVYLDAQRMKAVRAIEMDFHRAMDTSSRSQWPVS
jgi:hypothetical protein